MKPEAQRIAIAEASGWKIENYGPSGYEKLYWRLRQPDGKVRCADCTGEEWSRLQFALMVPNFTGSLDAMHEAEKTLLNEWSLSLSFSEHLQRMNVLTAENAAVHPITSAIHATAPQRAEALLKALSLWKP